MKLFDKLKNALFEEEYVEVEEKPVKKEKVAEPKKIEIAKKIELPPQKKAVEEVEVEKETIEEAVEELFQEESQEETYKFPMEFEDSDFTPEPPIFKEKESTIQSGYTGSAYRNKQYKESGNLSSVATSSQDYPMYEYGTYEKKEQKKVFQPSPVISPIYGVLDKNYKKEEIVNKKDVRLSSYTSSSRKMDIDAVREKAYGDLTNEIGLSMSEEEKKLQAESRYEKEDDDNLLFDMSDDDTTPAIEKVTMGDAEEYFNDLGLEYNVDYKDLRKEKASGRRVNKVAEPVSSGSTNEDSLESNLFDIIDSMYEEKE